MSEHAELPPSTFKSNLKIYGVVTPSFSCLQILWTLDVRWQSGLDLSLARKLSVIPSFLQEVIGAGELFIISSNVSPPDDGVGERPEGCGDLFSVEV